MTGPRSFAAATALLAAGLFYALQECSFLIPFRAELIGPLREEIGLFIAALFFNIWAAVHVASRHVALRRTGRKLEHLDRQLQSENRAKELARELEGRR